MRVRALDGGTHQLVHQWLCRPIGMTLTDEDLEGFDDVRPPPPAEFMLTPSKEVREATFTLLYDGEFAGTALAVGPRLVITAGHHFKVSQQDVGLLTLHNAAFVSKRKQGVGIAYVQKDQGHDLLLLWPEEDLPCVRVHRLRPMPGARVATVYSSPKAPHRELITSPGQVYSTTEKLCRSRGTVTTQGASGAPVIDSYGERIVGIHLSVSDIGLAGTWVSEFVPADRVVQLMLNAHADPYRPYRVEEEEAPKRKAAAAAATAAAAAAKKKATAAKAKSTKSAASAAKSSASKQNATAGKATSKAAKTSKSSKAVVAEPKRKQKEAPAKPTAAETTKPRVSLAKAMLTPPPTKTSKAAKSAKAAVKATTRDQDKPSTGKTATTKKKK
jgi:hypothetical protein